MAKIVIKAAYVDLGGTQYDAQVKSAELSFDAPEVDVSNMDSGGWAEILQGIRSGKLSIEFVKDADLSGLDSAVWTAATGAGTLTFEIRLQDAAVGATNPKYTGTVVVTQWSPVGGKVGDAFGGSVTWPVTGAITRAIA